MSFIVSNKELCEQKRWKSHLSPQTETNDGRNCCTQDQRLESEREEKEQKQSISENPDCSTLVITGEGIVMIINKYLFYEIDNISYCVIVVYYPDKLYF